MTRLRQLGLLAAFLAASAWGERAELYPEMDRENEATYHGVTRESYVTLLGDYGQGGRFGGGAALNLGLNHLWQGQAAVNYTRPGDGSQVLETLVGANVFKPAEFLISAGLSLTYGPGPNRSRGVLVEGQSWISTLVRTKRQSILRTSFGVFQHVTTLLPADPSSPPQERSLRDISYSIGLIQELFEPLFLELYYTGHAYSIPAATIQRAILLRRVVFTAGLGTITEFPKWEYGGTLKWTVGPWLSIGGSVFKTRTYVSDRLIFGVSPFLELTLAETVILGLRATGSEADDGRQNYLLNCFVELSW